MITVHNLGLKYGSFTALAGVNWQVQAGEQWCLLGPNGAGKTSLLRCVLGLQQPTTGQVKIQGLALADLPPLERARRIAYVPQQTYALTGVKVIDFLAQSRYCHSKPFRPLGPKDHAAMGRALEMTGLQGCEQANLQELSGGMRQLAYIAQALAQETPILALDEGFTGLDYPHQAQVLACLKGLREQGITILSVHHDLNQALALGGHALGIKNGWVCFQGRVEDLLAPGCLQGLYGINLDVTPGNPPLVRLP